MRQADALAGNRDDAAAGQGPAHFLPVHVAVYRLHGRDLAQEVEHEQLRQVAGVEDQLDPAQTVEQGAGQAAAEAGQVRVRDDAHQHGH